MGYDGQLTTPNKLKYGSRAGEAWSGASSMNSDGVLNTL